MVEVVTVPQLITAINPEMYLSTSSEKKLRGEAIKKIKDGVVKDGVYRTAKNIPISKTQCIKFTNKGSDDIDFKLDAVDGNEVKYEIVYNSPTESLEPVYFWLLDLMNDFGLNPEKLVDTFTSSPGSGHFSEMGMKASTMQQQATKAMGDVNTVLRSVLNLVYDLKEFRIRLQAYDGIRSSDEATREAAKQSLKQIWLDKVDMLRGNGAIHMMSQQMGYQTLRDAFLMAKDIKAVENIDLNERVKRIVIARLYDFEAWLEQSEKELTKRYRLEKNYLRSQVNNLKLYSRWVKPYLKAAADLEQREQGRNPDLVNSFNSILLQLTLLGKTKVAPDAVAGAGRITSDLKKLRPKIKRDYYKCVLADFEFRGIPQKIQQGYAFGGRVIVTWRAYVLNNEELDLLERAMKKADLGDVMSLIQGATDDSLGELQKEIDFFLEDKDEELEKKKQTEKNKDSGSNPFLALIGHYEKEEKKPKAEKKEEKNEADNILVAGDNWAEEFMRLGAAFEAYDTTFTLYDIYKKAHGMLSFT